MVKNLAIAILFALITSIPSHACPKPEARPEIKFEVNAKGTAEQVSRVTKLSKIALAVVNSPEFEERVKGAMTKSGKAFSYSDETGPQVYQRMIEGAELDGPKDGIWQLSYIFEAQYQKCFGFGWLKKCTALVLGWTDPSTRHVYLNSVPWAGRNDCGIVGTQVHEQLHKLGYSHPSSNTATRELSVPYAIGNLASEICKKII